MAAIAKTAQWIRTHRKLLALALALGAAEPASRAWAADAGQENTIRLVAAANTVDTLISEVIVRKAYARLGYRVEIAKYPAERALKLADKGHADGDVQRIDGLGRHYPNLIQLKPAINYIEGSAFTAGKPLTIHGWESLRPYRIGLIRGIKFAELNTVGMDRHLVGDYETLFKMLRKGRFELGVSTRLNGLYQLKRLNIAEISPLDPPLARFELYHYLHRSRAGLAPSLEAVFRSMQASGELSALRQAVIGELLRRAELGLAICDDDYACFDPVNGRGDATVGLPAP